MPAEIQEPKDRYDYQKWENRRKEWEGLKTNNAALENQFQHNKHAYSGESDVLPPTMEEIKDANWYGHWGSGLDTGGKVLNATGATTLAAAPAAGYLTAAGTAATGVGAPLAPVSGLAVAGYTALAGGIQIAIGTTLEGIGAAIESGNEDAYNAAMDKYNLLVAEKENAWLEMQGRRQAKADAIKSMQSDLSLYA